MTFKNQRITDRRIINFDFRKEKSNRRLGYRRKIDKINHSIYFVILFVLASIMLVWLSVDIYFLMGSK